MRSQAILGGIFAIARNETIGRLVAQLILHLETLNEWSLQTQIKPSLEEGLAICSVSDMEPHGRAPLEIEMQRDDDRTLVMVSGELDASTASYLYDALSDLELTDAHHLVLDLARLTFMDSTGLSVIVTEHKRMDHLKGTLTIFSPPSSIRRLFEITGLTATLDIVPANESP